jgi:hypothetical protein
MFGPQDIEWVQAYGDVAVSRLHSRVTKDGPGTRQTKSANQPTKTYQKLPKPNKAQARQSQK